MDLDVNDDAPAPTGVGGLNDIYAKLDMDRLSGTLLHKICLMCNCYDMHNYKNMMKNIKCSLIIVNPWIIYNIHACRLSDQKDINQSFSGP